MKRRIVSTVLILALIWLCSSTYAEEQARLWFDVNNDVEEYTVSVHISGNTGIEMLQFCLRYDYEKLELKAVSAGDAFRGITAPTISINTLGRVYLVWDALKPLPDGCLLILRFALKDGAAGNAQFFYDGDFETIAADGDYTEISLQAEKLEIAIGNPIVSPKETSATSEVTPGPESITTSEPLTPSDSPAKTEIALEVTASSAVESEQSKPVGTNPIENKASTKEKPNATPVPETKDEHAAPAALIVISLIALSAAVATLICIGARRRTKK